MYRFRGPHLLERHALTSRGCHTAYTWGVLSALILQNVSQLPPKRGVPAEQQPPFADLKVTVDIPLCLFGIQHSSKGADRPDGMPRHSPARCPSRGADQRDRTPHDPPHKPLGLKRKRPPSGGTKSTTPPERNMIARRCWYFHGRVLKSRQL